MHSAVTWCLKPGIWKCMVVTHENWVSKLNYIIVEKKTYLILVSTQNAKKQFSWIAVMSPCGVGRHCAVVLPVWMDEWMSHSISVLLKKRFAWGRVGFCCTQIKVSYYCYFHVCFRNIIKGQYQKTHGIYYWIFVIWSMKIWVITMKKVSTGCQACNQVQMFALKAWDKCVFILPGSWSFDFGWLRLGAGGIIIFHDILQTHDMKPILLRNCSENMYNCKVLYSNAELQF